MSDSLETIIQEQREELEDLRAEVARLRAVELDLGQQLSVANAKAMFIKEQAEEIKKLREMNDRLDKNLEATTKIAVVMANAKTMFAKAQADEIKELRETNECLEKNLAVATKMAVVEIDGKMVFAADANRIMDELGKLKRELSKEKRKVRLIKRLASQCDPSIDNDSRTLVLIREIERT